MPKCYAYREFLGNTYTLRRPAGGFICRSIGRYPECISSYSQAVFLLFQHVAVANEQHGGHQIRRPDPHAPITAARGGGAVAAVCPSPRSAIATAGRSGGSVRPSRLLRSGRMRRLQTNERTILRAPIPSVLRDRPRGGAGRVRTIGWLWAVAVALQPGRTPPPASRWLITPAHAARTAASGISLAQKSAEKRKRRVKKSAREPPPPPPPPLAGHMPGRHASRGLSNSWLAASHHCLYPLSNGENYGNGKFLRTEFVGEPAAPTNQLTCDRPDINAGILAAARAAAADATDAVLRGARSYSI